MTTHEPQTWGELFYIMVIRRNGGLPALRKRLAPVIEESPWVTSKGPYDDLVKMAERPEPKTAEYVRAWLLTVAADTDLAELGLSDDGLPPLLNAEHLRDLMGRPTPRRRKLPPGALTVVI